MKEDRRRGMRQLTTLRTLADQSAPASRAQAVGRFTRLENERARLMRELSTWNARKDAAERMLAVVEEELAGLKLSLLGAVPGNGAAEDRRPASPADSSRPQALIEY